jgi:hypothetical protein
MTRLPLLIALALLAALAALPSPATGCAPAPRPGESVSTADESALIVWDEATKTEHFVRRASFTSTGYDFGFLVPTPTRPHLDLADDAVFDDLSSLTAAKYEYRTEVVEVNEAFAFGCAGGAAKSAGEARLADKSVAPPVGGVSVLEQKKLGDYDATVLKFRRGTADTPATGAAELTRWLSKHGYEASAAIQAWLERYVQDEWCITAFKIGAKPTDDPHAVPNARRDVRARPVRMSFQAERPFYPYREPAAAPDAPNPGGPRLLRVFVASSARVEGTLGDGSKPWPGATAWAKPVEASKWEGVFKLTGLTEDARSGDSVFAAPKPAAGYWLTEFEDRSSPRPGTDEVYFGPSADASAVERPPIIVTNKQYVYRTPWWQVVVYFGVPAALFLGALGAWRMARRA